MLNCALFLRADFEHRKYLLTIQYRAPDIKNVRVTILRHRMPLCTEYSGQSNHVSGHVLICPLEVMFTLLVRIQELLSPSP